MRTAAWLEVADLTGPARMLRDLPAITVAGGIARAVEQCNALTERVAAVEKVWRERALADLPGSADDGQARACRTAAELGASNARGGYDMSPVHDYDAMPGSERLVEVSAYLARCASRAAGWRLVVGLPGILVDGGEGVVAETLEFAFRCVLREAYPPRGIVASAATA